MEESQFPRFVINFNKSPNLGCLCGSKHMKVGWLSSTIFPRRWVCYIHVVLNDHCILYSPLVKYEGKYLVEISMFLARHLFKKGVMKSRYPFDEDTYNQNPWAMLKDKKIG